jgi:hypothetical protein
MAARSFPLRAGNLKNQRVTHQEDDQALDSRNLTTHVFDLALSISICSCMLLYDKRIRIVNLVLAGSFSMITALYMASGILAALTA